MMRIGLWSLIRSRRHRESFRPADVVGAVAFRYLRMLNKGAPITVAQWNETVERIAMRYSAAHWTITAALRVPCWPRRAATRPVFPSSGAGRPTRVRCRYWFLGTAAAFDRLTQMRRSRQARLERETEQAARTCQCCGFVSERQLATTVHVRHDAKTGLTKLQADQAPTTLCVSCWNRLRPVFRIRAEAEELKRLTNQLKKVIHEKAA